MYNLVGKSVLSMFPINFLIKFI